MKPVMTLICCCEKNEEKPLTEMLIVGKSGTPLELFFCPTCKNHVLFEIDWIKEEKDRIKIIYNNDCEWFYGIDGEEIRCHDPNSMLKKDSMKELGFKLITCDLCRNYKKSEKKCTECGENCEDSGDE